MGPPERSPSVNSVERRKTTTEKGRGLFRDHDLQMQNPLKGVVRDCRRECKEHKGKPIFILGQWVAEKMWGGELVKRVMSHRVTSSMILGGV